VLVNTRGPNPFGHIIRWREQGDDPAALRFEWDIFVLAGTVTDSQVLPSVGGPALTKDNTFASPGGLWIDPNGILWIQTDMSGNQQRGGPFGENAMLAANPITGAIYRHPGDDIVPVNPAGPRPRSATIVITREDGGEIGLALDARSLSRMIMPSATRFSCLDRRACRQRLQ
jgi:uncharacterized protein